MASAKLNSKVPPRSQIRQLEKVLEIRVGRSSLASSNFALGAFVAKASFIRRSLSVDFYIFAPPDARNQRHRVHSKLRPCSATTNVTLAVVCLHTHVLRKSSASIRHRVRATLQPMQNEVLTRPSTCLVQLNATPTGAIVVGRTSQSNKIRHP